MRRFACIVAAAGLLAVLLAGCQSTQPIAGSGMSSIPRVTALYEQAADLDRRAHRFRKPYRDQQMRLMRSIGKECDLLLADVQGWGGSAELTSTNSQTRSAVLSDIDTLAGSLETMRSAAATNDLEAVGNAHRTALEAYQRIQSAIDVPAR